MEKSSISFLLMNFVLLFAIISFILIVFDLEGLIFVFELGAFLIFIFIFAFAMFIVYNNKKWGWTLLGLTIILLLLNIFLISIIANVFGTAHITTLVFSIIGLMLVLINFRQSNYESQTMPEHEKIKEYYPYLDKMEPQEETKEELKQELKKEIKEELTEEQKKSSIDKRFIPGKFVASKKANKFHTAKCDWAKRINKANQLWFNSREEAETQGFEADLCVQ